MKHLRLFGLLALMGLMILGATGCSDSGTSPTNDQTAVDDYEAMDMNAAYGGLTVSDETEAFGDADLIDTQDAYDDDAADDPLEDDTEVSDYEDAVANGDADDPDLPTITAIRLVWGQLDGLAEDIDESYDLLNWSGRIYVDDGIALARRVILFERPYDHLVHPRIDRHTVAWVSHTGPHYDGLIIEIIEPPVTDDGSGEKTEDNMLHLVTPLLTLDIPMDQVNGMDETYAVDEAGNALRIEGHRLSDLDLCPKGFLSGVWVASPMLDEEGNVLADGFFKGRWIDVWGRMMGFLRGGYGLNDAGEPVFFGKYINRNGLFRGLLSGTYELADETGLGSFEGAWINASETTEGVLGGMYMQLPERPGGFFSGRWATLCDQEAVDSIR